jgi:hypothetical protein
MFINCKGNLTVNNMNITTVNRFKYLGLILSDSSTKPEELLQARINKAVSTFYAVKTNCKLLGISNVRVRL